MITDINNSKNRITREVLLACAFGSLVALIAATPAFALSPTIGRQTLANGLQVVVVPDHLAPVVTVIMTYKAGSNEQQYPGQAHALEHMMFRGTRDVSSAQIYELGQLMGGRYNAQTKPASTDFYFTVPSQFLDIALRLEADRAQNLTLSQKSWVSERGAIEQEVSRDESDPFGKLERRTILPAVFAGTDYAKDGLGTVSAFEHLIDASVLRRYYSTWYRPNNAVLVIAGDVSPAAAIAKAKKYFGGLSPARLPSRLDARPRALQPKTYRVTTDYPATLVALAFRSPGWGEKDYAAMQLLEAVLDSQRSDLFAMTVQGKAYAVAVADAESQRFATASFLFGVIPSAAKPEVFLADLRSVLGAYQKSGVSVQLLAVAKNRALASAEFRSNSIEGLAMAWTDAVAVKHLQSPDSQLVAIKQVTLADVNRVLRTYLNGEHAITIVAVPGTTGKASTGSNGPTQENNAVPPERSQPLPSWARVAFARVQVPAQTARPTAITLGNGMHLIVQPEHATRTVLVTGNVVTNQALQAAAGKQGVEDILNGLFAFGTTRFDRLQIREQLDAIAAEMQAGTDFTLSVRSSSFDRGVQMLADDELHPRLPQDAFQIVKMQTVQAFAGEAATPQHLADVALANALYPAGDPERVFATAETAGSVTLDDVKNYYGTTFRPDMTNVVVIGDVTPQQARATFEKYFGSWRATGPKPDVALPAIARNAPAGAQVSDPARVQSQVQLAQVFPLRRADPDWAALTVANAVFGGGGFGSMLIDDLRTRAGLVYSADSQIDSYRNRSTFIINFASDSAKAAAAQSLALKDLQDLEAGRIDAARLQRSKTMLMSDIPLRAQSFGGAAGELLDDVNLDLPLNQGQIDARRELSATPQSVRAALRKWVLPDSFVRIILGPAAK